MLMIVHVSASVLWELWGLALHTPGFSPCGTHGSGGNPHGATAPLGSDFDTTWAAKKRNIARARLQHGELMLGIYIYTIYIYIDIYIYTYTVYIDIYVYIGPVVHGGSLPSALSDGQKSPNYMEGGNIPNSSSTVDCLEYTSGQL